MSSVSLTCAIKPAEGDPVRRVCSIPTGEGHLSCLSATLKDLQKEVNDSLTVLVEREREKGQGRKLAGEGEQDSKASEDSEDESDEESAQEGTEPQSKKSKS